eukprot:TRINITY_DN11832_c0_g1_i1.p1 TRINITY_DN11832_c0_g1~~TRINITY_DN11832_c0_g1_i1.p1  ORF type:complete len:292 (-),score=30.15 TRINITY_DN11832_c0_g1_i1:345-1220(-)
MDRFRCPGVLGVTPGVVTRSVHRRSKSTASRQVANVTGTPLRGCDGTLPPQPSTVPTPSRLLKVSVVASQASVAEQPISAATSTTAAACTPPGDPPNDQLVLAAPGSALSLPVWSDRCYPKSNFDLQLPRGSIPRGGGQLNVRMRCHAAFCRVVQAELVRLEVDSSTATARDRRLHDVVASACADKRRGRCRRPRKRCIPQWVCPMPWALGAPEAATRTLACALVWVPLTIQRGSGSVWPAVCARFWLAACGRTARLRLLGQRLRHHAAETVRVSRRPSHRRRHPRRCPSE